MRDQRLTGGTGRHAASITVRSVGRDQSIGNVQVAFRLNKDTAAAPVKCGICYVIGNVHAAGCLNAAVRMTADSNAAAFGLIRHIPGNNAASHCKRR